MASLPCNQVDVLRVLLPWSPVVRLRLNLAPNLRLNRYRSLALNHLRYLVHCPQLRHPPCRVFNQLHHLPEFLPANRADIQVVFRLASP